MNREPLIILIALILLAGRVSGLGVTPGKTMIDFQPNMERVVYLTVINNEQRDLSIALNAEGELSKYVSFSERDIKLSRSEGSKTVSYKIKLPESIGRPGLHEATIVLREAKSATEEGIKIGASLAVISILDVRVPYSGKYAEANLFALESDQEDETMLVVEVINYGEQDIQKAIASIDILDSGKNIDTVTTDEKPVQHGSRRELIAKWKAKNPGKYEAEAKLNYDSKTTKAETEFKTGGFFIRLIDIAVKNFKLGGIAKFQILLENIANKESKEVFTKMILNDETGKTIMNIESQRERLQPQERKELQAYWDTETVNKGEYNGKVALQANGEKWEAPMSMGVQESRITPSFGPTGMAVTETRNDYKTMPLIAILIICLIGVNIGWYLRFKRRDKNNR